MSVFFFNDTATTEIYTLSLHDALPIFRLEPVAPLAGLLERNSLGVFALNILPGLYERCLRSLRAERRRVREDRKSTRLNSSHANISYAVFCLKKTTSAAYPTSTLLNSS